MHCGNGDDERLSLANGLVVLALAARRAGVLFRTAYPSLGWIGVWGVSMVLLCQMMTGLDFCTR